MSDYQIILGYSVFIALMMVVAKTKLGYNAIYYALALVALGLVLTQSKFIVQALKVQ